MAEVGVDREQAGDARRMLGVHRRHPDVKRHHRELHHQADDEQDDGAGRGRRSGHPGEVRHREAAGVAVDDQGSHEEEQGPHDAPGQAYHRNPHALPVAEVRHQEEQRDRQDFHEEVHRDEVCAQDRPDEAQRKERKQREESAVVGRLRVRIRGRVQHRDPMLDVVDGVEGEARAQEKHDRQGGSAEPVGEQLQLDAGGDHQIVLADRRAS